MKREGSFLFNNRKDKTGKIGDRYELQPLPLWVSRRYKKERQTFTEEANFLKTEKVAAHDEKDALRRTRLLPAAHSPAKQRKVVAVISRRPKDWAFFAPKERLRYTVGHAKFTYGISGTSAQPPLATGDSDERRCREILASIVRARLQRFVLDA
ncbi:hypothetical protein L0Y69_00035 [bacterium]|nr:hypothetical protein [bacterium]